MHNLHLLRTSRHTVFELKIFVNNFFPSLQLRFRQMIFSFPLCLFLHRLKWQSLPARVVVTTKTMTFLRLSCSMKNCPQTLPPRQTFPNPQKGLICYRPLAGDNQGCTNVQSVTNVSSTTPFSPSTRGSTVGCSPTTARSAGGLSGQPLC